MTDDRNRRVAEIINEDWAKCPVCYGSGKIEHSGPEAYADYTSTCGDCDGSGVIDFLHDPAAAWKLLEWVMKDYYVHIGYNETPNKKYFTFAILANNGFERFGNGDTMQAALVDAVLAAMEGK